MYYFLYGVCQIAGGMVADRWGARPTMVLALMACSVTTALNGLVHGYAALLAVRALFAVSIAAMAPLVAAPVVEHAEWRSAFANTRPVMCSGDGMPTGATASQRLGPRASRWMAGSALLEEPSPTEETTLRKINIGGSARWR